MFTKSYAITHESQCLIKEDVGVDTFLNRIDPVPKDCMGNFTSSTQGFLIQPPVNVMFIDLRTDMSLQEFHKCLHPWRFAEFRLYNPANPMCNVMEAHDV